MAEWKRVRYVGTTPIVVQHMTWYPGEIWNAPAGELAKLQEEHGPIFIDLAAQTEPDANVTPVINRPKRRKS